MSWVLELSPKDQAGLALLVFTALIIGALTVWAWMRKLGRAGRRTARRFKYRNMLKGWVGAAVSGKSARRRSEIVSHDARPNHVASASASPSSVPSPTQAT